MILIIWLTNVVIVISLETYNTANCTRSNLHRKLYAHCQLFFSSFFVFSLFFFFFPCVTISFFSVVWRRFAPVHWPSVHLSFSGWISCSWGCIFPKNLGNFSQKFGQIHPQMIILPEMMTKTFGNGKSPPRGWWKPFRSKNYPQKKEWKPSEVEEG